MTLELIIKKLPNPDYLVTWSAMKSFTDQRTPETSDEIWLVEHSPVFTQGQAGKPEHVLAPGTIPIIETDRGGQVTYHGPGQLVAYVLLNTNRLQLTTRQFVMKLEQTIITLLADYGIAARSCREAPGVYVGAAKICSVGLRMRRGYSYHGLALNVSMDLEPFSRINPCGYANMPITQMRDLIGACDKSGVEKKLCEHLVRVFGYNAVKFAQAVSVEHRAD